MNQNSRESSGILLIYITRTYGLAAFLTGIAIIFSGPIRWGSRAYNTLNYMPGSPYTWGVIVAIAGAMIVFGSIFYKRSPKIGRWQVSVRNLGLWALAAIHALIAVGFGFAVLTSETTAFNIPVIYALIGLTCIFLTKSRYQP